MAMAWVRVRPMTVDDATHVTSWHYPHRWSVYDLQSSIDILDELHLYRSITDADGTLIGFSCLESAARVRGMSADPVILDVGVGMNPSLVGHGSGRAFGGVVLDHVSHEYPGRPLRAVIQSWNLRSRRFAASLGFVDIGELARSPCSQQESYRVLLKPEQGHRGASWWPVLACGCSVTDRCCVNSSLSTTQRCMPAPRMLRSPGSPIGVRIASLRLTRSWPVLPPSARRRKGFGP
jgi:ribosomal-protein-alanine N-acetyltransferase